MSCLSEGLEKLHFGSGGEQPGLLYIAAYQKHNADSEFHSPASLRDYQECKKTLANFGSQGEEVALFRCGKKTAISTARTSSQGQVRDKARIDRNSSCAESASTAPGRTTTAARFGTAINSDPSFHARVARI